MISPLCLSFFICKLENHFSHTVKIMHVSSCSEHLVPERLRTHLQWLLPPVTEAGRSWSALWAHLLKAAVGEDFARFHAGFVES